MSKSSEPPPPIGGDSDKERLLDVIAKYEALREQFNEAIDAPAADRPSIMEQHLRRREALLQALGSLDIASGMESTRILIADGIRRGMDAVRVKVNAGNGYSDAAREARQKLDEAKRRLGAS